MRLLRRAAVLARTPSGRKAIRYGAVSAFNVAFSQTLLVLGYAVLRWPARTANLVAAAIGIVPAYVLSRRWVWQRSGRSNLLREVAPFWGITAVGIVASTYAAGLGEGLARRLTEDRSVQSIVVASCALLAYGVVWVAKFVIFDRLFAHQVAQDDDFVATDAR